MFSRAKNVVVNGGSFVAKPDSSPNGLDKLFAAVAPNAILNAGGRADEVRCFPGTREEVIGKLEAFMDDNSASKKRMMWLSGPAGAGKSAIFQTVAEHHGEQAVNFFFFRGDSTRSHRKPLVATLVYQLRRLYPALDEPLSDCLEKDPLICGGSIHAQFKQLISSPIQRIQQATPIQQQIVIFIDGLDECNEKSDQDQILVALHKLAHADRSPFVVLVSSRAEPHLVMSFNRLGSSVESMFLNDDYTPQKDIRLFVVAKFDEIKKDHHLAQTLSIAWPPDADIDAITDKSSGQFIYAATVMRYIQFSSENPALSLVTVLEMSPCTDHNPFAHLDAVYSHIFSKVRNIGMVKLILFARKCAKVAVGSDYVPMLRLVGCTNIGVQSLFADLAAIIKVDTSSRDNLLVFYHASLEDYLGDKSRSTTYYVNENRIAAQFSSMCLENIVDADSIRLSVKPLSFVQYPTPELSKALLDASTKHLSDENPVLFLGDLIGHIERLYWEHDKAQFKALLLHWSCFVYVNNIDEFSRGMVRSQNPSASWYYEQYWVTERSDTTAIGGPDHSLNICEPGTSPESAPDDWIEVMHHQPGSRTSHAISTYEEEDFEEERKSRDYDCGHCKFYMIRVKLHYQDDIRGMTLTPDTPFTEFVNKVTVKFGKNFDDFIMKFKDEDDAKITLWDDSDYEHAIETARESSKGKATGKLEIWCQERAQ